jgi:hypothetical protein
VQTTLPDSKYFTSGSPPTRPTSVTVFKLIADFQD